LAIVKPAIEKNRSDGAEVAGINSAHRAYFEIMLYFPSVFFLHLNGHENEPSAFCHGSLGSSLYNVSSAIAASMTLSATGSNGC
jgi:hypothetical protein